MTACNSDRCHCPACNEFRRERTQDARIGSLETRVDGLEIHKARSYNSDRAAAVRRHDYETERQNRFVATEGLRKVIRNGPRGKTYLGYKDERDLVWRWEQTGTDRWCRRMLREPFNYFGAPVYRRYFTPDGNPIKRPRPYASGGVVSGVSMSREEYIEATANCNSADWWEVEKARERKASILTPKFTLAFPSIYDFPTETPFTELKKDSPTMSISAKALAVLTYIHAHSPRANDPDVTGREARDGYIELLQCNLIESGGPCGRPTLTKRGEVLMAAINALPLPVREEAPWVMPKA